MSLKTWKKEFLPVTENLDKLSTLEAIEHSVKKWEGLLEENLYKHKVLVYGAPPRVGWPGFQSIPINDETCALCAKFSGNRWEDACSNCPLYLHLGKRCDSDDDAPFTVFCEDRNPVPMYNTLVQILEIEKEKNATTGISEETA